MKNSLLKRSSYKQYDTKLSKHRIGHAGTCRNQKLTIEHFLEECLQRKENRRKYDIYCILEEVMRKNFKMKKLMKFLKDIGLFEDIQECHGEDEE